MRLTKAEYLIERRIARLAKRIETLKRINDAYEMQIARVCK